MVGVDDDITERHHSSGSEVGALLVVFPVLQRVVESIHACWDEVMRLEQIQVIVIDANVNVFATLLLLLYEACGQTAASRIYDRAAFLALDRWMQA